VNVLPPCRTGQWRNSGSEDGGEGTEGWAAPPSASLGDALAAALARAGTQPHSANKKKVPVPEVMHELFINYKYSKLLEVVKYLDFGKGCGSIFNYVRIRVWQLLKILR
jgi:hypothetical protein